MSCFSLHMKAREFDTSPSAIRITRFLHENKVRFIVQNRDSLQPCRAYSLYEAFLSRRSGSHNTVQASLSALRFLATWAKQYNIKLDELLLNGEMLEAREVNAFGAWLRQRGKVRSKKPEALSASEINKALHYASQIFVWFAEQYAIFDGRSSERAVQLAAYASVIKSRFSNQRKKLRKKRVADDLSEEEIAAIEQFLKPHNRQQEFPDISPAEALRDYLFWRLVIEFGLREGEVLALRLEDCPRRDRNNINIVRIDERGDDYIDPRVEYAPRPKTLSRELGFLISNSPIPRLIKEYTTKYRRRHILKHGRKVFQPVLDVPAFLILSHQHHTGTPLSISSIQDVAKKIRQGSGISRFHWHLGRHAFFNRAYAAIMDLKNSDEEAYKERLRDLVYWGGWDNQSSLQLYVNRARKERAKNALSIYQAGGNQWEALK